MNTIVSTTIAKELANQNDPKVQERRVEMLNHLYMGHPPGGKASVVFRREAPGRSNYQEPGLFRPASVPQLKSTLHDDSVQRPPSSPTASNPSSPVSGSR